MLKQGVVNYFSGFRFETDMPDELELIPFWFLDELYKIRVRYLPRTSWWIKESLLNMFLGGMIFWTIPDSVRAEII